MLRGLQHEEQHEDTVAHVECCDFCGGKRNSREVRMKCLENLYWIHVCVPCCFVEHGSPFAFFKQACEWNLSLFHLVETSCALDHWECSRDT